MEQIKIKRKNEQIFKFWQEGLLIDDAKARNM